MTDAEPSSSPQQPAPDQKPAAPEGVDLSPLIAAVAPVLPDLIRAGFKNGDDGHRRLSWLAGTLIAAMAALAGFAIFKGANDTAEKIVIAMVSFLSGSALFGKSGSK